MKRKGTTERNRILHEKLEQLKEEYGKLHELKIATARHKKNLEEELQALRQKAEKGQGTSDVEKLRALMEQGRKENEKMVKEYEGYMESIKEKLDSIERKISSTDDRDGSDASQG